MPRELKTYNVTNDGSTVGFSGGASFMGGATKVMRLSPTEVTTLQAQGFTVEENTDGNAEPNFFVGGWSARADD